MNSSTTKTDIPEDGSDPHAPQWAMVKDLENNQFYSGFVVNKKPNGFGVLLSMTHLVQGLWMDGSFLAGFSYDLKEQKFSFCVPRDNKQDPTPSLETIEEDSNGQS